MSGQLYDPEFSDKEKYVLTHGRYEKLNDMKAGQQHNVSTWSALAFPRDVKSIAISEEEFRWFPWVWIARDALRRWHVLAMMRHGFPSSVAKMVIMYCD